MLIRISKKNIIIVLMIIMFVMGCFIWYRELGTNREIPKRAKFVNNFSLKDEKHG